MPKRKREYAPSTANKRYRRRKVVRARRAPRISRPLVSYKKLLAPRVLTKLTYCDTVAVSPATGSARHVFRMNSIQDVDYTGVGHQPAFHDRWAQLYNQYRVLSCAYQVTFMPYRSDHNANYIGAVDTYPFTDSSAIDQRRLPGILFTEVVNKTSAIQSQSGDYNVMRETKTDALKYVMSGPTPRSYTIRGSTNLKRLHQDPEDYAKSTAFASNPGKPIYLHCGVMSKFNGGTTSNYHMDVKLVMTVELTDPIDAENEN